MLYCNAILWPLSLQYWLDIEKQLNHQVGLSTHESLLKFCVKFYTPDPSLIEEEYTRYLFGLQIKRDLATAQLQCNDNTAALMASYIVQGIHLHSLFSQIRSITCQYVVQGEEDIVIYVTYRKKGGKLEWQARSARASLRSCHIAWIMYVNHVMFPMWTLLGKEMGSAITRTWFLITFTEAVTHVRYISVVHWYVSIVHAALHALFCRLRNKPEYWDYQSHGKKGKNDNYIEHILSSIFQLNVVITW